MAEEKNGNGKQKRDRLFIFIGKDGRELTAQELTTKKLILALAHAAEDDENGHSAIQQRILKDLLANDTARLQGMGRSDIMDLSKTDPQVKAVLDLAWNARMYGWKKTDGRSSFQGIFPYEYRLRKDGTISLDSTTRAGLAVLEYIGMHSDQRTRRQFPMAAATLHQMSVLVKKQIDAIKSRVLKKHPEHAQDLEAHQMGRAVIQAKD